MIVIFSLKILFWLVLILLFPSIDNASGLETVSEIPENKETDFPHVECAPQAINLCTDATTQ